MNCKNKSFMTKKKAFTLVELLIVIAIIGILFIVLVSKVDFATDKAKATGVQTDFRSFQTAFESVSKENAGFNIFGWDTGDVKRTDFHTVLAGYTYDNEEKDRGDKVRNSYDEGDINLNGICDTGETFTGRKVYTEVWTEIYTLVKPGTTFAADGYDKDAIFALETAINKNLDPKLHITIANDGKITMANGAQDPWNTQYHGAYISAEDGMDRGAIVMYSNGANQKFGSEHDIANGVPTVIVPGNNKNGADDYSLVVCYTYANGYGEVGNLTTGFSKNQIFNAFQNNEETVLDTQHQLTYYDNIYDAMSGTNILNAPVHASFATYVDNGMTHILFLKDLTFDTSVNVTSNMILDLNGKTILFSENTGFKFDGIEGKILATSANIVTDNVTAIECVNGAKVTIENGTFSSTFDGSGTQNAPMVVMKTDESSTLLLNNVKLSAVDNANGTVSGISNAGNVTIENSEINVDAGKSLENVGVYNSGICIVRNTTVIAKADYVANDAGNAYASTSRGILSDGGSSSLEIYNSSVWGAHSGITARGDLKVEGGTYEGYGHGGIYVASYANAEIRIHDASINWAEMKEGTVADSIAGTNGAGMYIGGCSNVNVYMDNCTVYGTKYGVVLRGSGGEQNNMLYISNSTFTYGTYSCRMNKAWTSRVYIGIGNNFDSSSIDFPSNTVTTTDNYR